MSDIGAIPEWVPWEWRHRTSVLVLCVLAYFGVRFVEFALSVVFPDIKTALGISSFTIGLAVTVSTITYALAQLPSGALGDRFGERTVVLASVGLTGLASVLLATSSSGLFVVLGMGLVGAVSGAYYSPATSLLTDAFDDTGRAIGIHRLGAQAVGFTAPIVAVVGARYSWRVVLLLGAAITVPVLAGFAFVVRSRPPACPDTSLREQIQPSTLVALLSRPRIAFTTVVAGFAQFADTAAFSFLPLILREYHRLSIGLAGTLFTLYFVILTATQPVAGWLSDRFGRDPVTAVALLLGVVGYLGLLLGNALPAVAVAVGLIGLGMGWGPPVQSRFMDALGEDERGVGFGLVRTVYIGFAALNGAVVGGAATLAGWRVGIGVLVFSLIVPAAAIGANRIGGFGL
ncbi:MFS transporter [Halococcus saccharolyticus]|uniref:Major facilitator superfamily MFS_1 n=1 Tax=Halococcus saccharolyticus DSM 5350 TaxID=1227455 RepID=M0ME66_9EURY|nr:MFS transporter [Halococcus saccharolyticus]EMA44047.1 major facilitator superfamily MFS_1 [Halococcus saccharolyticus DSM 5350]